MAENYDVVIVGGGIMGSCTAYNLAGDPDFDGTILVIERDPTYEFASTTHATGGVRQQFSTPENIWIGLYGAEVIRNAGELLEVDGDRPDVGFRENGYLLLAPEQGLADMKSNHAIQTEHGATVSHLDAAALKARFPFISTDGIVGGFIGEKNEGWYDPYGLLQAFKRKARSQGAVFGDEEAVDLVREGKRITGVVLASGETVGAGCVVNCGGARDAAKIAEMAGVSLPVEPRKRTAFVIRTKVDVSSWPLTIHPNGVWGRPEGAGGFGYLTGCRPEMADDGPSWEFEPHHDFFEETVWPTLYHRFPEFEELRLESSYACHYDYNTFDQNAILGLYPGVENFFISTGYSGHGVMQGPACGRAMTELIVHGEYRTLDLSRFGVERILEKRPIFEFGVY
jgi:glycine/D-amino acid oxidase-like deaminating enzyme